ncbi:MAG: hypothetical protein Q7S13_03420 [Candidatus Omnitrophota bacterium]|nr:hypothetical protein [Candidatus Omnitrophota bacterium]
MKKSIEEEFLEDNRVIEEIKRHLWIESEKAGHDIGFDKAKQDWFEKFAKAWMEGHLPKKRSL